MKIKDKRITQGFIVAGLMNLSVLVFSRGFTNSVIPEYDPVVMSNFGMLMIVIWGLAYMTVAKNYHLVKWLIVVFALEKLIYGAVWIRWMMNNNVAEVFEKDVMAGTFFSIYGVNDLLFCVFFFLVSIGLFNRKPDLQRT